MGSGQSSNHKDVKKALDEQRRMYEHRIAGLIREQPTTTSILQPQPATVTNLERQRTSYSYTSNDVQSQVQYPGGQNLYPNLYGTNSNNAHIGGLCNVASGSNYAHYNNFVPPQASQPTQSFQPSAPPVEHLSNTRNINNSRSNSRQRGPERGPDDDITCRTCGNKYEDKIFQCNQGHSSCAMCKTRVVPCGQCRQQITTQRNFNLENYVAERKVKCPNSADGCRLFIKIGEMEAHKNECPFKEMMCPTLASYCSWRGKLPQLLQHFEAMHQVHRQADVDKEMVLSISDPSYTMHFIQIGSFNFLVHIKVFEQKVCMAVQLIGTKHSAGKWYYDIHIFNKREPRRKFQYIDRCSSNSEPINEIFADGKCAVIPILHANTFVCNGTVAYKFYIKKDDEAKVAREPVDNKKKFVPRRKYNKNNN